MAYYQIVKAKWLIYTTLYKILASLRYIPHMKRVLLIPILLLLVANAFATFDTIKPPIHRQRLHDKINEEQKTLDKADGKLDGIIKISGNQEINLAVTDALTRKVD